jgi:hypothetical protein
MCRRHASSGWARRCPWKAADTGPRGNERTGKRGGGAAARRGSGTWDPDCERRLRFWIRAGEAERGSGEVDWGSWAGCVEGESTCIGRGRGSMVHQTVEIDGRQNGRLPLLP